jgi:hypothetical protein
MNSNIVDEVTAQYVRAIIETIKEVDQPMGAPGGLLYAALMTKGVGYHQFERLMSIAEQTGEIVKRGDCYFPVHKEH